jgi:hypothetical protein
LTADVTKLRQIGVVLEPQLEALLDEVLGGGTATTEKPSP